MSNSICKNILRLNNAGKHEEKTWNAFERAVTTNSIQALSDERKTPLNISKSRRGIIAVATVSSIIAGTSVDEKAAIGLDFGLVAPDQTFEEAQSVIREHARALLEVKDLIDSESWKDARSLARKSVAYLKKDFYTIIQNRPKSERPKLRQLYFDVSYNVSQLDFAARDQNASRVLQCYDEILIAVTDILSRI